MGWGARRVAWDSELAMEVDAPTFAGNWWDDPESAVLGESRKAIYKRLCARPPRGVLYGIGQVDPPTFAGDWWDDPEFAGLEQVDPPTFAEIGQRGMPRYRGGYRGRISDELWRQIFSQIPRGRGRLRRRGW